MLLFIDFCWSRLLVKECLICCCCDNHDFLNRRCHLIVCCCTSWNSLFLWDKWKRKSVVSRESGGIALGRWVAEFMDGLILGKKKMPKNKLAIKIWTLVFLDKAKLMSNKLLEATIRSWSWLCLWTSMLEKGVRPQRQCAKIPSCGKTLHPSLAMDFVVKSFWGNFGTTCWFRFEVQVLHLEMTIAWWSYSLRFGTHHGVVCLWSEG